MEFTQLGQTDLHVSRIAFGTWSFGGDWGAVEAEESKRTIRRALDLGINFFDTAQAYGFGASESILGDALREEIKGKRHSIVLATKGGLRKEGAQLVRDASAGWLHQGLESSLRALGTDYIDLYQVHWPDPHTGFEETALALDAFVKEGKIRYVGVSNFDAKQMAEFEQTRKIDALQPPYHLFRRDIERSILPYTARQGIGVLIYGPLAHGLLTGKYTESAVFAKDDWRSSNPMFQGEPLRRNVEVVRRVLDHMRLCEGDIRQLRSKAFHLGLISLRQPDLLFKEFLVGRRSRLRQASLQAVDDLWNAGQRFLQAIASVLRQ